MQTDPYQLEKSVSVLNHSTYTRARALNPGPPRVPSTKPHHPLKPTPRQILTRPILPPNNNIGTLSCNASVRISTWTNPLHPSAVRARASLILRFPSPWQRSISKSGGKPRNDAGQTLAPGYTVPSHLTYALLDSAACSFTPPPPLPGGGVGRKGCH
ncbi:hypothetical protein CEXT_19021 [Caerostris extrusa]|uniref:Uncharacterized protein n=1 Tax=Caerostris extrusa TaxID=172846 RepID=A0AAV4P7V6_CAEEX|nr:hypothetical protein CEXT_19021 [Caerostris extrusa]